MLCMCFLLSLKITLNAFAHFRHKWLLSHKCGWTTALRSNISPSAITVFSNIIWTAFTYAFEDKCHFYTTFYRFYIPLCKEIIPECHYCTQWHEHKQSNMAQQKGHHIHMMLLVSSEEYNKYSAFLLGSLQLWGKTALWCSILTMERKAVS